MKKKTLPREPWRGSQICGYQTEYGTVGGRTRFCGERKEHGMFGCREHHQAMAEDEPGGILRPERMAAGNAIGDRRKPVRLLWEPPSGDKPIQPTEEELAAYPVG